MTLPPTGLGPEARLRHELVALLRGGQAHAGLRALEAVPEGVVDRRAPGFAHTLWGLVQHLRVAQADILAFAVDPAYAGLDWPDDYWPSAPSPPGDWDRTVAVFHADLDALVALAETADLTAELAHAEGYTILRQVLLAADHNSHHLGQIIDLRRALGVWPPGAGVETG